MTNNPIKYENLKKWEKTLASCIRCGYCFEHCPISKYTKWESDTPRAKIIMAHGLLAGELEPSEYIADKLFSCFFCKRCEAACSSGVSLLDIFVDTRKDLIAAGFNSLGSTSITELDCAGCLSCVRECPHDARSIVDNKIVTDPVKCQACGRCIETCPAGAAHLAMHFGTSKKEINHEIVKYLQESKEAKAIIFACNWSYFPDLQSSTMAKEDSKAYKIIVNMCGGRLEKATLMEPFLHNAKGVLVACCTDGDCEHDGHEQAKSNVRFVKNLLKSLDINPEKIHLVQIKHGDKSGFQMEIDTFMATISGKN
ncbi:MAG: hydrogenase iron-sulfur subunit [Desulfobacteraceae bacterium]|nr:hydrogenase iron-sulfur subunit [Desulfobacteraceae bacterium]